jgi:acyl dehydratase
VVDHDSDLRKYVGMRSEPATACDPVEPGAVRRFVQAVGDDDPVYWDAAYAATTPYGVPVAPPLYVSHVARRPPGTPDPFDRFAGQPDLDGSDGAFVAAGAPQTHGRRLPEVDVPQVRLLNGGVEAEFFALPAHGDRITSVFEYVDVYEREGRSGPMVFVVTETTAENQDGRLLARVRNTTIRR